MDILRRNSSWLSKLSFGLLALLIVGSSAAQSTYPTKPIRMIVPLSTGGPTDTAARLTGQALTKVLGQTIVVDNRPGADQLIGAQAVVGAPPDGYTFLFAGSSSVSAPLFRKSPPFDPHKDLVPIAQVCRLVFGMFVFPGLPTSSVNEFIDHARANAGKLHFGSSNHSEYMVTSQFMKAANIRMARVPYKGSAQAIPDLIAGRIQINFIPVGTWLPYAKDGRLRLLAVIHPQRLAAAPEVPTFGERGFESLKLPNWQGILGPKNLPTTVVDRIARELGALKSADVRAQFERMVMTVDVTTPAAFAREVMDDLRNWDQYIRENAIPKE